MHNQIPNSILNDVTLGKIAGRSFKFLNTSFNDVGQPCRHRKKGICAINVVRPRVLFSFSGC